MCCIFATLSHKFSSGIQCHSFRIAQLLLRPVAIRPTISRQHRCPFRGRRWWPGVYFEDQPLSRLLVFASMPLHFSVAFVARGSPRTCRAGGPGAAPCLVGRLASLRLRLPISQVCIRRTWYSAPGCDHHFKGRAADDDAEIVIIISSHAMPCSCVECRDSFAHSLCGSLQSITICYSGVCR